MTVNRTTLVGAFALLIGLLLGFLIRGGGDAEDLIGDLAGKVDGISADVKGLGERLGSMEGSVSEIRTAQQSTLTEIGTQLQGLGRQVTDTTQTFGGEVQSAVRSQIEDFRSQLSALTGRGREGGGDTGAAEGAAASGTALTPGSTTALGDGKLRVFLSSSDAEAGTARVAINGPATTILKLGESTEVDGCRVALTGFDAEGAAMIDGGC